jgi:signal transduction histidine kinase/DNA-binding response OmpR family regulator
MNDKINILIVDDLPEKLLVLESVLAEIGENLVTARSGGEALQQVLKHDFAVILLDVNMPGMDGFETAALIRRRKKSAHTPIIFITAYADQMHTAQGYSLGAVDYIFSPVVPEVLCTKVRVFVELARMTQQVQRQAEERAARVAAEEMSRRTTFLADASKTLACSLDYEATLRALLGLVVPRLADLGVLALVNENGVVHQSELAWMQPGNQLGSQSSTSVEGLPPALAAGLCRVLRSGRHEHLSELKPAGPEELRDEIPVGSAAIFPLLARGRVLGALAMGLGYSGRRYESGDLTLAEDFASRAAIAIDNARLYREVQEADRRKNEFLSMLAHELRNPLAPIRNAVQIMRLMGPGQPGLQEVQDMIDRQVHQLVRLVDDLLDISRITRGKIRLQTERVDLTAVVSRALETSRPLLNARKHELRVVLPPEPVCVKGDVVRLAQVLTNLLNNAAKYTQEGGKVWLTVEHDDEEVILRVRDTGAGIPPEMLSDIFDLFTQVERSLDRSQGGLGIGLTLVRRLVEMHGGSVHAFSPGVNQGSEFVVRLPVLQEAQAQEAALSNGLMRLAMPTRVHRILVVDDNQDAADSLAMLLRLAGQEIRLAHDGPTALSVAESFHPEVVMLDIGLPGLDGYEVARRLRQRPGGGALLLIALTGYGQEDDQRRSREAGFDHHLVKPVDPHVLAQVFVTWTEHQGENPRASAS